MRKIDLTGRVFTRWTVIGPSPARSAKTMWRCRCICGQEKEIETSSLRVGDSRSCGCLRAEVNSVLHRMHGDADSSEHIIWMGVIDRCTNKNSSIYAYYGGRGIAVDPRWEQYENFLMDMGRRPEKGTLERQDNNGPYAPWNCVWDTRKAQARNKRNNFVVTYEGRSMCVAELAELKEMNYFTLYYRLTKRGMSAEAAVADFPREAFRRSA